MTGSAGLRTKMSEGKGREGKGREGRIQRILVRWSVFVVLDWIGLVGRHT